MIDTLPYISKEYITPFLPSNPKIIEAGANKGRDTIECKKIWPNATIYAFEPVPELFEQLRANTANLNDVFYYPYALSDANETADFFITQKNKSIGSLLTPGLIKHEKPSFEWCTITVQTITLNNWAESNNISSIDFMWLDLQGAELAALKGATHLLNKTKVIHCEVCLVKRYENQGLYNEIVHFLASFGFKIQAEALYHQTWGNALFVK